MPLTWQPKSCLKIETCTPHFRTAVCVCSAHPFTITTCLLLLRPLHQVQSSFPTHTCLDKSLTVLLDLCRCVMLVLPRRNFKRPVQWSKKLLSLSCKPADSGSLMGSAWASSSEMSCRVLVMRVSRWPLSCDLLSCQATMRDPSDTHRQQGSS